MQPVPRVLDQWRTTQLHSRKITAAIRQPLHRRQTVRLLTGRQPCSLYACFVSCSHSISPSPGSPPSAVRPSGGLYRRGRSGPPTVAFADMADFCQPAVLIILPLLRRVAVHRPVRDAVRRIVMPEGDKPLIFTLREFSGQVIVVTLRPPVKAAAPSACPPGHTGTWTGCRSRWSARWCDRRRHTPHAARQSAFRHTHRTPAFIIFDGAAFTVR